VTRSQYTQRRFGHITPLSTYLWPSSICAKTGQNRSKSVKANKQYSTARSRSVSVVTCYIFYCIILHMSSPECPRMPTGAHIYIYSMCMKLGQNPSAGNDLTRLQKSIIDLNAGSAARRPSGLVMCCFSTPDGCDSGPECKSGFYLGMYTDVPACTYRCRSGCGFCSPLGLRGQCCGGFQ
jgi:hypothetical protein